MLPRTQHLLRQRPGLLPRPETPAREAATSRRTHGRRLTWPGTAQDRLAVARGLVT